MHTLSRLTGWMILALALASPAAGQTQPAQPPAADPVKEQQERAVSQPGNNAPVWREVRSGQPNYTSIPGREAGVLMQPQARFPGQDVMTTAGEAWRSFRNGPITFYGGWLLVLVTLAIAAGIGLLIGVDTIPDMFRTSANVVGWLAGACILGAKKNGA
mgnify:CR=1 FL=1